MFVPFSKVHVTLTFFFTFSEQSSLRWMSGCITFTGQRSTLKIQTILYAKQWSLNSRPMILDIKEHKFSRFNVLVDYKFTAVSQVTWTKPGRDFIVSTNKSSLKAHAKSISFFLVSYTCEYPLETRRLGARDGRPRRVQRSLAVTHSVVPTETKSVFKKSTKSPWYWVDQKSL